MVVNHENVLGTLAKGLCQIADALPRAELAAMLYPTKRMLQAVTVMYAQIIRFLMRALEWFQESIFSHALHSITRPTELRYDDLVKEISQCASSVNELALASSQAEQRDMHLEVQGLKEIVIELKGALMSHHSINNDSLYEIRQMVSGIQASHVMTMLSTGSLLDHIRSLQSSLFTRSRRALKRSGASYPFWLTPKIQLWNSAQFSSLIMIKGTFRNRFHVKDFCTNIIELSRDAQIPTIWVLPTSDTKVESEISTIDLLKSITLQAFRLIYSENTGCLLPNHLKPIITATSEDEWLRLLCSILEGLPQVYIIIDIEVLSPHQSTLVRNFAWPPAFLNLFRGLRDRGVKTIVKVVLVSYGSQTFNHIAYDDYADLIVPFGKRLSYRKPKNERGQLASWKGVMALRSRRSRGQLQGLEKAIRATPFAIRSR